jgi:hypothetical protein
LLEDDLEYLPNVIEHTLIEVFDWLLLLIVHEILRIHFINLIKDPLHMWLHIVVVFDKLLLFQIPLQLHSHILHDISSLNLSIALGLHDHNELFSVDQSVSITVCHLDHFFDLVVTEPLAKMPHDETEFVNVDLAAAIFIEDAEGLDQLLLRLELVHLG